MSKNKDSVVVKTKVGDFEKLGKSLALDGELVVDKTPNGSEQKVSSALEEAGIKVILHHFVGGHEFDMKISGFPVLVEVDGSIHDQYTKRLKDLRKDREAAKRGFRVLRFSTDEPASVVVDDVRKVIGALPRQPREVWLVKYRWWTRFAKWVKKQ